VILRKRGLGFVDVLRIATFVLEEPDLGVFRAIRDRYVDGLASALAILVVKSCDKKQFMVEIKFVAAKVEAHR
jgi:enamine deaminase RidA (YjgF/YER057c/UK114 family)